MSAGPATAPLPGSLGSVYRKYQRLAPEPPRSGDCTAALLVRYLTATGLHRAVTDRDGTEAAWVTMTAALLLAHLQGTDQRTADRLATVAAAARPDSGKVTEWLRGCADLLGLDSAEVERLAGIEAAVIAERQQNTEEAARQLAGRAGPGVAAARALERVAESHERLMYAASIEIGRGAAGSARRMLSEQLDGYDGPPWNGTETGPEYLERTAERAPAERL